ncbi:sulfotransferase family protein [Planctomycetaceae bacterium SH139]
MSTDKINVFMVGASKAGTTSVWTYFRSHPSVSVGVRKEPRTFAFEDWRGRVREQENEHDNTKALKLDASPIYSQPPVLVRAAERIYKYNPEAKLIYILREPIARIHSAWKQALSSGHHLYNVYKAKTDVPVPKMPMDLDLAVWKYPLFVESCKYYEALKIFGAYFPEDQIKVLFFEDLVNCPEDFFNDLCGFLGIEHHSELNGIRANQSSNKKVMPGFLARVLLNSPPLGLLRNFHSDWYKSLESKLSNGILMDQELSAETRNRVVEYLQKDVEAVLCKYSPQVQRWSRFWL